MGLEWRMQVIFGGGETLGAYRGLLERTARGF